MKSRVHSTLSRNRRRCGCISVGDSTSAMASSRALQFVDSFSCWVGAYAALDGKARRASSRRTRCRRAARCRATLGDCWRQATHAAILVAAHRQCANQSASISSNARCSFFILWPQPSADARTAYKPTDNAKTGPNRDCFGTVACPGAPPHRRASSRRTRCGAGPAASRATRGAW